MMLSQYLELNSSLFSLSSKSWDSNILNNFMHFVATTLNFAQPIGFDGKTTRDWILFPPAVAPLQEQNSSRVWGHRGLDLGTFLAKVWYNNVYL